MAVFGAVVVGEKVCAVWGDVVTAAVGHFFYIILNFLQTCAG